MSTVTPSTSDLSTRISNIRKALLDGATGPLRAAPEVMALVAVWETKYKADAGDVDIQTYLRKALGRGRNVRFFSVRNDAVAAFGLRNASLLHHDAAVWLYQRSLATDSLTKVRAKIAAEFNAQGQNPLTRQQLLRVYQEALGAIPKMPRNCGGCNEKEGLLAEAQKTIADLQKQVAELQKSNAALQKELAKKSAA